MDIHLFMVKSAMTMKMMPMHQQMIDARRKYLVMIDVPPYQGEYNIKRPLKPYRETNYQLAQR